MRPRAVKVHLIFLSIFHIIYTDLYFLFDIASRKKKEHKRISSESDSDSEIVRPRATKVHIIFFLIFLPYTHTKN